jgi:hypothetical protein
MTQQPRTKPPQTPDFESVFVLALVAAKPSARAPLPWLVARLAAFAPGQDAPSDVLAEFYAGGPVNQRRWAADTVRCVVDELEPAGALAVERIGDKVAHVRRARNAEARYLFRGLSASVLAQARGQRTTSVEKLAELCGVQPRTAWRWRSGTFAAPPEALAKLLVHTTGQTGPMVAERLVREWLANLYVPVSLALGSAGLTTGEQRRAQVWLDNSFGPHAEMFAALARQGNDDASAEQLLRQAAAKVLGKIFALQRKAGAK